MKKYLCYFFFLVAASLSAKPKDGYNIQFRIKGLKDTVCYLAYYYGDKQYIKDTAQVDATGSFIFKGTETLPTGIYILVLKGNKFLFDFVVKEQSFSIETDTTAYETNMKVKGSEENKIFNEWNKFLSGQGKKIQELKKDLAKAKDKKDSTEVRNKMKAVDKEVMEYKNKFNESHPGTFVSKILKASTEIEVPEAPKDANGKVDSSFRFNYYKAHFWDNIDFTDDGILRTPIFHQKLIQYLDDLTYKVPDSISKAADYIAGKAKANKEIFKYVVWYITNSNETSKMMGADAVFVHMIDNYYKTKQAYWLDSARLGKIVERGTILKPLLIGKKAPNLILKDSLGAYKILHNINSKYIVLFFYDPECGHCKKETPELYKVYQKIKPMGVEVYAVSTIHDEKGKQEKKEIWKKFIKSNQLDWINVQDDGPYYNFNSTYDIYSVPVIYILNDKKEIIAKRLAVEQIEDFIELYQKRK